MHHNPTSAAGVAAAVIDQVIAQLGCAADVLDDVGEISLAHRLGYLQDMARHLREHGRFRAVDEALLDLSMFSEPIGPAR